MNTSDERLTNLEARLSWIEHHGLERDKAMVEMGDEIRRLRREIAALRERLRAAGGPGEEAPPEETPPHY